MSSERLSRNDAALTATTLPLRKGAPESHNRRSSEDYQQGRARGIASAGAKASAKHRYPRYIPSANVAQLLLDSVLISGCQAVVFTLIRTRLDLDSLTEAL